MNFFLVYLIIYIAALASSLLTVAPMIGKQKTGELILPVFSNLLKDQDSEVRINLLKKLGDLNKVIGVESLLNSIIPALQELNNDKNWRIRKATIEHLAFFAKQIGPQFFSAQIIKLLLTCINDRVYSVRFLAYF